MRVAPWGSATAVSLALSVLLGVNGFAQSTVLAITNVHVVDVESGRVLEHQTVTIADGIVASVSAAGPGRDVQTVDGAGAFLIPGLWDMHAHTEMVGVESLPLHVANGVTTIRDMGSALDLILSARADTAFGRRVGPRIFAAGPILDDAPGDWPYRRRVRTADEGRAAVRDLHDQGVDLIKVHDNTKREVFTAIADEARRLNLRLAGHVPIGMTPQEVIDAGQGDIEHLSNLSIWGTCTPTGSYRLESCRDFFAMLARRQVWQTPTLSFWSEVAVIGTPASAIPAEQLAYASGRLRRAWAGNQSTFVNADVVRQIRERSVLGATVTRDMASLGVGILAGCDGVIPGFCLHDELRALVRGGLTPLAALQTATRNPARYFGLERTHGNVAAGHRADLVLLEGNPLEDISQTRRIRAVVANGRLFERPALDALLAEVRAAAAR